jgi:hypothetical protein
MNRITSTGQLTPVLPRTLSNTQRHAALNQQTGRNTAQWRRIRLSILTRDAYHCRLNHPGCTGTASTVHLVGGGYHHPNAQYLSACRHCHASLNE